MNLRPAPIKVGSNTSISNSFHPRPLQSIQPNLYPLMAKVVRNSLKKNPCGKIFQSFDASVKFLWMAMMMTMMTMVMTMTMMMTMMFIFQSSPSDLWRQFNRWFPHWTINLAKSSLLYGGLDIILSCLEKEDHKQTQCCENKILHRLLCDDDEKYRNGWCNRVFRPTSRASQLLTRRAFQGNDSSPYQCNCLQKGVFFL